jgi:hypothetical protein
MDHPKDLNIPKITTADGIGTLNTRILFRLTSKIALVSFSIFRTISLTDRYGVTDPIQPNP